MLSEDAKKQQAPTSPPDYQRNPSSSFDFPEPSACCGFSAGSSSKPSLQTCQGDETHGRIWERKKKVTERKLFFVGELAGFV